MRINKYSVIWTDDNGVGHVICFVDNRFKLFNIEKRYMVDFFGDIDIDVLTREKVLFDQPLAEFREFINENFIKMFVYDMIVPEKTKIYKTDKNEYICYKNNQKIVLYSPEAMKERAEINFQKYIEEKNKEHEKKYHIVQGD